MRGCLRGAIGEIGQDGALGGDAEGLAQALGQPEPEAGIAGVDASVRDLDSGEALIVGVAQGSCAVEWANPACYGELGGVIALAVGHRA